MSKRQRFLHRGDDAMQHLREEQQREEQRREQASNRGPFRFFCAKDGRGGWETHEIVFLDDDLTDAVHAYEHAVPGPNNDWTKTQDVTCIDDWANCPICRAAEGNQGDEFKPPRYQMFATVLDLTPYTIKNGPNAGKVRETTRKMYPIPMAMMDTFKQMFELCKKQNGTTRGMVCLVTKKEKNDARCGEPQMIAETGMLFDFMTEEELEEYADDAVVRDGKTILEEGENIEPFDYEEVLEPKSEEEIRRMFNLAPAVGSRAEEESTGSGRTRRRRKTTTDEGETQDAPPKRTRRRRAAATDAEDTPAAGEEDTGGRSTRSRRRRNPTPADDEVDIPFDEGE